MLDSATLETVKVGKSGNHELLNCDDHQNILKKNNRDIAEVRPDIAHQVRPASFVFFGSERNVDIDVKQSIHPSCAAVLADAHGQPPEQGWAFAGVHAHAKERLD